MTGSRPAVVHTDLGRPTVDEAKKVAVVVVAMEVTAEAAAAAMRRVQWMQRL